MKGLKYNIWIQNILEGKGANRNALKLVVNKLCVLGPFHSSPLVMFVRPPLHMLLHEIT